MTSTPTFLEWLTTGRLAPYVKQHHSLGSAPLSIFHVRNPPGDVSDPATSDLVLALIRSAPAKATCDLGAGRFRCRAIPGEHYLSAPYFRNTVIADDPQDMMILSVPDQVSRSYLEGLTDRGADFAPLHAGAFTDPLLTALMTELWREAERADEISRLFVDSATSLLVTRLWRLSGAQRAGNGVPGGLSPWAQKRAVEYMRARLGDPVTLLEVAGEVRLSPAHFCTAFRQSFGMPPHRWLMLRRIEKAKEMLAASRSISISDVALACGFSTSAHFASAFRRHVGMPPRAWRRLHES